MAHVLPQEILDYIEATKQHHLDITCELGVIPAPSHHEEKRVEWVKAYMEGFGATGIYVDDALNLVWPIGVTKDNPVVVLMAHTDVVFPDTDNLPLEVRDGKVFCPGIGDNTVNLTALLLVARYIQEKGLAPAGDFGVLIVANSCEEGLGNLKGVKKICDDYAGRIVELTTFDGTFELFANDCIGSHRYRLTLTTEGGHSYSDFGNRNAIAFMASMVQSLYTVKVPPYGKTTYNVGLIEGGTSVNTIAQDARMMYEYRSNDRRSLAEMEAMFNGVADAYRNMGVGVEVELLGVRPCRGEIDMDRLNDLTERAAVLIRQYSGRDPETVVATPSSSDAIIPLSRGIPAICMGLYEGAGAHTREEYLVIDSLPRGMKLIFAFAMQYFK